MTNRKSKKQRLAAVALIALLAVFAAEIAGCNASLGGSNQPDVPELDGLISLSKTEDVQFKNEKEPIPLKANLLDGILEITNLEWSIAGDNIAALSGAGEEVTVTPNGALGEAVVTAKLVPIEGIDLGDLTLESTFKLDVIDLPVVTVAAIGDIMLKAGNTPKEKQISASYAPDIIASYQPIFTWEFVQGSDKAEFANSSTGADVILKAKSEGAGKVKAKLNVLGHDFYSAETAFNVLAFNPSAEPHDSITITGAPSTLIATDQSAEFSLSYQPASALYSKISWVYDTNKLNLDYTNQNQLKITPKAGSAGTYTITAKSDTATDVKAAFTLTVQPVTVSLAFDAGKADTISKSDTTKLVATVNAKNKAVTWTSANTNAASVDGGTVTGLGSKTTASVAITAKSAADASAQGSKNVNVKPPTYTLVYDKNGGAGSMTNESRTYGTVYTLKQNSFTKNGFNFAGWYSNSAGTGGTAYTDKQANVDIEPSKNGATVTLFAQWKPKAPAGASSSTAEGGEITFYKDGEDWDEIHTFKSNGTLKLRNGKSWPGTKAWTFVVGGGGGGGSFDIDMSVYSYYNGGGGGAGEVVEYKPDNYNAILLSGQYAVTVGAGGAADSVGGSSSFGSITASGGKNGERGLKNYLWTSPSGGNSGNGYYGGGAAIVNKSFYIGGGGAGSSANGGNAGRFVGGNGGVGTATTIRGTSERYAGGGGGSTTIEINNYGKGADGGGDGGYFKGNKDYDKQDNRPAKDGKANSGGGGGGTGSAGDPVTAAKGGSGIVIIRFRYNG